MTARLHTIGYEGATVAAVVARLQAAGVALVVDVRAVAASRRPGFSKIALAATLAEAGIGYLHLRALGTPKEGRLAARAGQVATMRAIFAAHLATPDAQDAMAALAAEARRRPVALLCFESDAACCHRRAVAERLADALGPAIDL